MKGARKSVVRTAIAVFATATALFARGDSVAFAGADIQFSGAQTNWVGGDLVLVYMDTSSLGSLTIPNYAEARLLAVGGGGAGGTLTAKAGGGGGGGAGGFHEESGFILPGGTYKIKVGAGGKAADDNSAVAPGGNGEDSYIRDGSNADVILVRGGGGGGAASAGSNGGSGGGGSHGGSASMAGGQNVEGQGNAGGASSVKEYGGGGGGAGGSVESDGRKGGAGASSDITGEAVVYGGGGGGGRSSYGASMPYYEGGIGGGGSGGGYFDSPTAGTDGLGGGGGGGGRNSAGANGGSGIVVIRISDILTGALPTPADCEFVYDGEVKTVLEERGWIYSIDGVAEAVDAGSYKFTASFTTNLFVWGDGSATDKTVNWSITKADNGITELSIAGWRAGNTAPDPVIKAAFGVETVKYTVSEQEDGEYVSTNLTQLAAGDYYLKATILETKNYRGAEKIISFTVSANPVSSLSDYVDIKVAGYSGSETINDFILAVRISEEGIPGFTYDRAGVDGKSLEFMALDGTVLNYDVDVWDPTGESLIWVRLPQLPPEGTTITMYWALKEGQTTKGYNPAEVWSDYAGVWHMSDAGDSSPNGANGTIGSVATLRDGLFGSAMGATKQGSPILTVEQNEAINSLTNTGFTATMWVYLDETNTVGTVESFLFGRKDAVATAGYAVRIDSVGENYTAIAMFCGEGAGSKYTKWLSGISVGRWIRYDFYYSTTRLEWWVDGVRRDAQTNPVLFLNGVNDFAIGGLLGNANSGTLMGAVDEFRLRAGAVDVARLTAENEQETNPSFTTFGIVHSDGVVIDHWTRNPSISPSTWDEGEISADDIVIDYGRLASGAAPETNYWFNLSTGEFGEGELTAKIASSLPAGSYRVVFTPPEATENYSAVAAYADFSVIAHGDGLDIKGDAPTLSASGRVLLMNRDGEVDLQCYGDTSTSLSTFWEMLNSDAGSGNMCKGTESMLWTANKERRLWHLVDARHGNTFPTKNSDDLDPEQNYLPWSSSSYSCRNRSLAVTRNTVGNVILRNTTNACVYSSCFTNGIGAVYFDAVNGWISSDGEDYIIAVDIATNCIDNVELPPTDDNIFAINTEYDIEWEGDVAHTNGVIVTTNYYAKADWRTDVNMVILRCADGNISRVGATNEFGLAVSTGGTTNDFYRIYVPLEYYGPIRFRIRRVSRVPASINGPDDGGLILLDNIIASEPARKADLEPFGTLSVGEDSSEVIGWAGSFNDPYPAAGDPVYAGAKVANEANAGYVTSAKMLYRWRYLNQVVDDWSEVYINPADGFKAAQSLVLNGLQGDIEFKFVSSQKAPFYRYVDYSGTGLGLGGLYSEEITVVTNSLGSATNLVTRGRDWFVRLRDGRSNYGRMKVVVRDNSTGIVTTNAMALATDGAWQGYYATPEPIAEGLGFRILTEDYSGEGYSAIEPRIVNMAAGESSKWPFNGMLRVCGEDEFTTIACDAVTGGLLFHVDESALSVTVIHADRQDFNAWTDAKKDYFVGTSITNSSKTGTSPVKKTFVQTYENWLDMPVTDTNNWVLPTYKSINEVAGSGHKTYTEFTGDTDNLWTIGPGMWVARRYKVDTNGVALQMTGNGLGYAQMANTLVAPRGLETVSFDARLAQPMNFNNISYCQVANPASQNNYTFSARVAFDRKGNTEYSGIATLSLFAYYREKIGCYELRLEQTGGDSSGSGISNNGQTLSLYRWRRDGRKIVVDKLGTTGSKDLGLEIPDTESGSSGKYLPMYISISNDVQWVDGVRVTNVCIMAGVGYKQSLMAGEDIANQSGRDYHTVCYRDTSDNKLVGGTVGVLSANCPGVFLKPYKYTRPIGFLNGGSGISDNTMNWYSGGRGNEITFQGNAVSMENTLTNSPFDENNSWVCGIGRMSTFNNPSGEVADKWNWGLKAEYLEQTVGLYTAPKGTESFSFVTNVVVYGFGSASGDEHYVLPVYSTEDCAVKIQVEDDEGDADSRTDVAISSLSMNQWRGDDWDNCSYYIKPYYRSNTIDGYTNYIFTSSWIADESILLSAKRATLNKPSGIRGPFMFSSNEGYDPGLGLGMIAFDYRNAQSNANLRLEIATNRVTMATLSSLTESFSDSWTTVTNFDFSVLTDLERESGTMSYYLGLHSVTGLVRLVVEPATVEAVANVMDTNLFGNVSITKMYCRDEPAVDDRSWWGWNLKMVGGDDDTQGRMLLRDFGGTAGGNGMSLALNDTIYKDIDEEETFKAYQAHAPFVQTPTFTSNLVGEVTFRARKYVYTEEDFINYPNWRVLNSQPAQVTVYGAKTTAVAAGENDEDWERIEGAVFVVSNDTYSTYTYKVDSANRYCAFRLIVSGVEDVLYPGLKPEGGYASPVRVLIDDLMVSEAMEPIMAFRNVGTFRSHLDELTAIDKDLPDIIEQPLCGEGWGVQCEVFPSVLADEIEIGEDGEGVEVYLHWYKGTNVWGYTNWASESKAVKLSRATDTDKLVFRSSYLADPTGIVDLSQTPEIVQYMLEVRFNVRGSSQPRTSWLTAANADGSEGWVKPPWYKGVDYNETIGDGAFAAYTILDEIAFGWAWINEVNLCTMRNSSNVEADCQFVEIAVPAVSDLTGWTVRMIGGNKSAGNIVTNVIGRFGSTNLSGRKADAGFHTYSNMVFRVIGSPSSDKNNGGKLDRAEGELDATWDFADTTAEAFESDGRVTDFRTIGIQLVRPSGIVEHEITTVGTNRYTTTTGSGQYYNPQVLTDFYNENGDGGFFYIGEAGGGEGNSMSVLVSNGSESNQWSSAVARTPGKVNVGQIINPDDIPMANGENIVVYAMIADGDSHIFQTVGDAVKTNETQILFLRRGNELGTNIVYTTDRWYDLDTVTSTTNGYTYVNEATRQGRTWVVNVGAGASNNVTVVASSKMQDMFVEEYGLTKDNPYTPAVMDWLVAGTDYYGNAWPNADDGNIYLAEYRNLSGSFTTNMTLTSMYWLDIPPTVPNMALIGGVSGFAEPTSDSGKATGNKYIRVKFVITNGNDAVEYLYNSKNAWAPYVLRGLEPQSNSIDNSSNWTSVTFKVVGILDNGGGLVAAYKDPDNWLPLRYFVFNEDSFDDDYSSEIEVLGYKAPDSPWYDYYLKHLEDSEKYPINGVYYQWRLNEWLMPKAVEMLKKEGNYYTE